MQVIFLIIIYLHLIVISVTFQIVMILINKQKELKMKTYDVIKVENGYQVIWFWANDYIKTGFKSLENYVDNGFFKDKNDAENYANELEFFGEGGE